MPAPPFDVARARRDTPGCERVIHFNNAGASLMPEPVLRAATDHLELEAAIGGYEAAEREAERLDGFYRSCAALLGCSADEIAFADSATRAWDIAFYSLPMGPGDRILTARAEYASNFIAYLQVARRTGAVVEVIPNDETGQLCVASLSRMIDERTRLISITHVPTNGGLVNPAAEVGRLARDAGVPYLLDACQSVGQMRVDVEQIGCDFLSATGRKYLRAPRGTGFLYVRRGMLEHLEPVFLDLHSADWTGPGEYHIRPDARRFETWEQNVAGKLGLAAAVDYARGWGLDSIGARVSMLGERLRSALRGIRGVTVADLGAVRCGIVGFDIAGHDLRSLHDRLATARINVSVSEASSTRLDMEGRGLDALVRASVHYYNTETEIERFCEAVEARGAIRAS